MPQVAERPLQRGDAGAVDGAGVQTAAEIVGHEHVQRTDRPGEQADGVAVPEQQRGACPPAAARVARARTVQCRKPRDDCGCVGVRRARRAEEGPYETPHRLAAH
jgi:hypothetical protein